MYLGQPKQSSRLSTLGANCSSRIITFSIQAQTAVHEQSCTQRATLSLNHEKTEKRKGKGKKKKKQKKQNQTAVCRFECKS